MDPEVDDYISRSEKWSEEMAMLRPVLLDTGLNEEIKWGKPCYSHEGGNIVIIQEMKDFLSLMFFKGALLSDPEGVLVEQGPNSRSARRIEFTSIDDVTRLADTVGAYVADAIDVEETGLEVPPAPAPAVADELQARLDSDPAFRAAFEALTPGRQREYTMYISAAKQVATRESRIDKCEEKILAGKGLRE